MILFSAFRLRRFVLFCAVFVAFALLYMIACDDPVDFAGISVVHDSLRNTAVDNVTRHESVPTTNVREFFHDDEHDRHSPHTSSHSNATTTVRNAIQQDVRHKTARAHHYQKFSWSRVLNMFYFSISNTITMGYGDIYPISPKAKLLVITQILCLFLIICLR